MPLDVATLKRMIDARRRELLELEALLAELEGGSPSQATNGATELTAADVRAMCKEMRLACNALGEMDSETLCRFLGVEPWQVRRWVCEGTITPLKRGGGRRSYFGPEQINQLRRTREQ